MRWLAKLVARLLATAAVWAGNRRHLSKIRNGRQKQEGPTHSKPKNIKKCELSLEFTPLDGWPVYKLSIPIGEMGQFLC
jgi:hypothetical protein